MCWKFHIPTSRKSLTCFICDENKTYRKAIKNIKHKPVCTMEIWRSFIAYSASNNARWQGRWGFYRPNSLTEMNFFLQELLPWTVCTRCDRIYLVLSGLPSLHPILKPNLSGENLCLWLYDRIAFSYRPSISTTFHPLWPGVVGLQSADFSFLWQDLVLPSHLAKVSLHEALGL